MTGAVYVTGVVCFSRVSGAVCISLVTDFVGVLPVTGAVCG